VPDHGILVEAGIKHTRHVLYGRGRQLLESISFAQSSEKRMAKRLGPNVTWRFQGLKSCCWLTCIEMVMHYQYGNIYGPADRTGHSQLALDEYRANKGSHITLHADHYNLVSADSLDSPSAGLHEWSLALRKGPVVAEGRYGWARFGPGRHVIVVTGISTSGKLIYLNPNGNAVMPHPISKETYISIEDIYRLRIYPGYDVRGPFWQVASDPPPPPPPTLGPLDLAPTWGASARRAINSVR
jgi:hypothetical protein